jgi:hypothetical protein
MRQVLAGMSPRLGLRQVPRLRTETHFGVQARALPVGLHPEAGESLYFPLGNVIRKKMNS